MQYPYFNKTHEQPVARKDGTVYAYQWTSWRLTTRGAVIYRVVRQYLCGHSHETFRIVPSDVALASDSEHRAAMLVVLSREASASPYDRSHQAHPQCDRGCGDQRHHEPAALWPRRRRPRLRQSSFPWMAASA